MIEFVLVVYMGSKIINQTQTFEDIDRCLYFAERLSRQPAMKKDDEGRTVKMMALCKPVSK